MAALDEKAAAEILKTFGPTEEHRKQFGQSMVGSAVGQTLYVGGQVAALVLLVVLLAHYWQQVEPIWLQAACTLAALFALTFAFSILPALLRARRDGRLKATAFAGAEAFKPGYFRLQPYGEGDRQHFKRLDGADATIGSWLASNDGSLLYLSGASGVGKSSLLSADVLPKLRAAGWAVVEARLFGDPCEQVRTALLEADGLFGRRPPAGLPVLDLLRRAAEGRDKRGAPPVLVVVDQFEEFLILHKPEERAGFTDLLHALAAEPIPGLRFLLVFRSDYRPLVFKLGLPPPVAYANWQELAPYNRGEANSFLQGGGRQLAPESLDKLLRGLDRIEDARGLYRPITLNMVGLVLERMGARLEGDPSRLIQSYLLSCLTKADFRDFARPVLGRMITDAGTKEPRSEADLAASTGLEPWQVKATLGGLAEQGLVRPLHGRDPVWEVSHDFLARLLGPLIGRLKPGVFSRARPFVAPVALAPCLAFAVFALPTWREDRAESFLRRNQVIVHRGREGDRAFGITGGDELLRRVLPTIASLGGSKSVSVAGDITSLEPLSGLPGLAKLWIIGAARLRSLEPLGTARELTIIRLPGTAVADLRPLQALTGLSHLDLSGSRVEDLEPLRGLTGLRILHLSDTPVTSVEPLRDLAALEVLHLANTRVGTLSPLKGSKVTVSGVGPEVLASMKE